MRNWPSPHSDLAQQDVKRFQQTVDVSQHVFKVGGISQNHYLKIQVQLLQYQSDLEQARVAREQALSDLRQLLGYESVAADYDVEGIVRIPSNHSSGLKTLQLKALQNRPDLRAAKQGVTAAGSQFALAKADGKQDVTGAFTYSHVNSINTGTVLMSVPLPFFNRNQGEILRTKLAITQAATVARWLRMDRC